MTVTYGRHGRVVVLTLDDTVGFVLPPTVETTQRLVPPPRRPNAVGEKRIRIPRTIGIVDSPCQTGALPLAVQAVIDRERAAAERRRAQYVGRHHRPGLLARWFRALRLGRRDGV